MILEWTLDKTLCNIKAKVKKQLWKQKSDASQKAQWPKRLKNPKKLTGSKIGAILGSSLHGNQQCVMNYAISTYNCMSIRSY